MKIRRFEKKDLCGFEIQDAQRHEFDPTLLERENVFTLYSDNGVWCIFGYSQLYPGRVAAFSFINRNCGKVMTGLVKKLKKIIEKGMEKTNNARIEISVLDGFLAGQRMARLLGFEYEGLMRRYFKGRNYKLYARIF